MKKMANVACCGAGVLALTLFGSSALLGAEPSQVEKAKQSAKDALQKSKDAAKNAVEKTKQAAHDAMGGDPDTAKMEQAWMNYSTPNEHHAMLKAYEGTWNVVSRWWQAPGMPPSESTMTAVTRPAMGGRFYIEEMKGEISMGEGAPAMPFEGMAIMGYDNHKKMHFSTWIDNMGTGLIMDTGSCSSDGKVITTSSESYNPMYDKIVPMRSVATIVDENTRRLEMYGPGPDGKEFKTMELVYTRAK